MQASGASDPVKGRRTARGEGVLDALQGLGKPIAITHGHDRYLCGAVDVCRAVGVETLLHFHTNHNGMAVCRPFPLGALPPTGEEARTAILRGCHVALPSQAEARTWRGLGLVPAMGTWLQEHASHGEPVQVPASLAAASPDCPILVTSGWRAGVGHLRGDPPVLTFTRMPTSSATVLGRLAKPEDSGPRRTVICPGNVRASCFCIYEPATKVVSWHSTH